jgi:type I restriction enzyme S subunit
MTQAETIWKKFRLRYLFSERIGGAWGDEPYEGNAVVCIRAADFETDLIGHKTYDLTRRSYKPEELINKKIQAGDLLIEKSGGGEKQPVGRIAFFSLNDEALCSNFIEILRPNQRYIKPKFGAYLLYSLWATRKVVQSIKQTTGIQNLDVADYLDNTVFIPDLTEQGEIADYLDHEAKFIENLIRGKERILSLLTEKRLQIIKQASLGGLKADAETKNTGILWLPKIPSHWKMVRTRWLFNERNERSITGNEEMLSVSHLTGVTSRSEKDVNMFEAESNEGYKICYAGDLVINTLWAWMGAMGTAPKYGMVSPAYHVYVPSKDINPDFIDAIVRLPIFAKEVTRYSKGVWSSRLRLYPEGFYEVFLPVPPVAEQAEIVSYIREATKKIDVLYQNTEKTINLLKERRNELINSIVTGQKRLPKGNANN